TAGSWYENPVPRLKIASWIACTLLAVVAAAAPPSVIAADCPLPGTYAVTITGRLASGVHFARLALYSFEGTCNAGAGSGSVAEHFWYFPGDATGHVYGSTHVRIGVAADATYAGTADKARTVRGIQRFNAGPAAVSMLTGTW